MVVVSTVVAVVFLVKGIFSNSGFSNFEGREPERGFIFGVTQRKLNSMTAECAYFSLDLGKNQLLFVNPPSKIDCPLASSGAPWMRLAQNGST